MTEDQIEYIRNYYKVDARTNVLYKRKSIVSAWEVVTSDRPSVLGKQTRRSMIFKVLGHHIEGAKTVPANFDDVVAELTLQIIQVNNKYEQLRAEFDRFKAQFRRLEDVE